MTGSFFYRESIASIPYQFLFRQQLEAGMLLQLVTVPIRQILHIGNRVENAARSQVVHVLRQQHLTRSETLSVKCT